MNAWYSILFVVFPLNKIRGTTYKPLQCVRKNLQTPEVYPYIRPKNFIFYSLSKVNFTSYEKYRNMTIVRSRYFYHVFTTPTYLIGILM